MNKAKIVLKAGVIITAASFGICVFGVMCLLLADAITYAAYGPW